MCLILKNKEIIIVITTIFRTPQIPTLFRHETNKIWKFENGFNEDLHKWIKNNFEFKIKPITQKKTLFWMGITKLNYPNIIDIIKNNKLDFKELKNIER